MSTTEKTKFEKVNGIVSSIDGRELRSFNEDIEATPAIAENVPQPKSKDVDRKSSIGSVSV
jgi:hypothetical protein